MGRIVEEYWRGVARRLLTESDIFNRLIGHNGEMGTENETSLAGVMRKLLPARFETGGGVIIDSTDQRSAQTDLIVFDKVNQPGILAQTTQKIYPLEVLSAAVEVKTSVRVSDVGDYSTKSKRYRALKSSDEKLRPFAFFGYECADSPASIIRDIAALDPGLRPEFGCIMIPGIFWESNPTWRIGFVPNRKADGGWLEADGHKAVKIDKVDYPTFTTKAYGREFFVGDPGRALLLFARAMWQALETDAYTWLDSYMSDSVGELMSAEG